MTEVAPRGARRRIDGEAIGRWSLRLDAGYCAVLGLVVALLAGHVAAPLAVPRPVVVVVGIAVMAWAGGIVWMLGRLPLRSALRLVMVANLVAALAVALVSVGAATVLVALAVVAVAVDVGLFAVSQAVALRALAVSA